MSNIRGKKIKVPHAQEFSFYFSGRNSSHGIRVKPIFNPDKIRSDKVGTLKLCDDWEYTPGADDKRVSKSQVAEMKQFFRDNLVLFAAVWDNQLYDSDLEDYLYGQISLDELIHQLDFYSAYAAELDKVESVAELEDFCRENELVNMYGN